MKEESFVVRWSLPGYVVHMEEEGRRLIRFEEEEGSFTTKAEEEVEENAGRVTVASVVHQSVIIIKKERMYDNKDMFWYVRGISVCRKVVPFWGGWKRGGDVSDRVGFVLFYNII